MFTDDLLKGRVHYGVMTPSSSAEFARKIEVQAEDSVKEGYDTPHRPSPTKVLV